MISDSRGDSKEQINKPTTKTTIFLELFKIKGCKEKI
nr:MAG TPA: hypothetical protein [Caudoviricetes sp.]